LTVGALETAEILTVKAETTGGGKSATAMVYTKSALFVAVGSSDKAAYSFDGENWEEADMPSSAYWYRVTYGGGKFVAVAHNSKAAAYSADGITWHPADMPGDSAYWYGVTYGDDKFVAVDLQRQGGVFRGRDKLDRQPQWSAQQCAMAGRNVRRQQIRGGRRWPQQQGGVFRGRDKLDCQPQWSAQQCELVWRNVRRRRQIRGGRWPQQQCGVF
jgi:hypothetical protein